MRSILDPSFKYTPSIKTDVKKTFARIRREQRGEGGDQERRAFPAVVEQEERCVGNVRPVPLPVR